MQPFRRQTIGATKIISLSATKMAAKTSVKHRQSASSKAGGEALMRVGLAAVGNVLGYKLRRAQLHVFQDFLASFSKLKLRPAEFSVLALMAQKPGQKQSEIAEALGIKRANFVALMDGLEKRGLAVRRRADTDRRSHSLYLTPAGNRFVAKMATVWQDHESRFIARLGGPAARDQLIELLDRILADDNEADHRQPH
jgi:DNA-binding MarR family transcriptional regulator